MTTPPEFVTQEIRERLKADRESRNLTIREHAEWLGISEPTYFRVQRGRIDKTAIALLRLVLVYESPEVLTAA